MDALNRFLVRTMGWMPARVALGAMAWLGFINLFMVRLNLSVIIVAMVGRNTSASSRAYCYNTTGSNQDEDSMQSGITPSFYQQGEFDWSETIQGLVLGSFSYGYLLTQVVGGRLAEVYGVKWVFGGCILAGGVSNLLSPAAARLHYGALITLRVLQGLCQGVAWPSMHACLAQWIPPLERSRFVSIVYFASTLGTAMTMPLCGLIIDNLGWPAAFYIIGSLSLAWCIVWALIIHSTPAQHPRISPEELQYIESAIRTSGTSRKGPTKVPWRHIATSLPVWAIIICDVGNSWGISLLNFLLPTFMKNILGFSIKANGALSALPFICRYVGALVTSSVATWVSARGLLSVANTRRAFSVIAMLVPAALVVALVQVGCDWQATIAILCLALFFNGAVTSSIIVNHTDVSPNFSGTLFGVGNMCASVVSFIVPVVTGIMTDGQQTLGQWRKVFWVCVPMYVLPELFYLAFLSGSVQPWNYDTQEPTNLSTATGTTGTPKHNTVTTTTDKHNTTTNTTIIVPSQPEKNGSTQDGRCGM